MTVNPLRVTARILTGSTYAMLGLDAARAPGGRVGQAAKTLAAIRKVVPLPGDDELIVRANGAVQAAGGALLALGVFPRLSAVAVAVSLVPTTLAGHPFWAVEDPATRKLQQIQFHKNMALVGGLFFAALDAHHQETEHAGTGLRTRILRSSCWGGPSVS